ncbi:alkaline phosphatase family protein [Wenjunlia tyrosinilytica]|uniref:MAM domain-containing protein n=1 Tax=Wenjunlia tyrosinilytica TaxID=1544741 RepID=A0A917ZQ88_9ACTN|nr:alkaline phosphatase family protein [Wenjunlia tyrosinilytica]GGO89394.1 hypothetical protein GCM10012280_32430 [Wenjunlia tyrosinilytica]
MRPYRIAGTICASVLALAAAGSVPAISTASTARHQPSAGPAAATAGDIPEFDHVVVVLFENKKLSSIKGNSDAPYFNSLSSQGTLLTGSYALTHPSQPNYIGLFSGSTQGVSNDDCPKNFTTGNLGQQLLDAGQSFKAYSEGLPSAGYTGCSSGKYRRKHAPWANFPTVGGSSYNLPFSSFPSDYSKLPTVSFVTPDMCSDMHDCSIGTGDSWLKSKLDGYAQWAKTHNSLLVTTFDEDSGTSVNQIYTSLVGEHVKVGYESTASVNHYSVLRTLEDMYGLRALGKAADKSPITDAWTTSTGVSVANPGNQSGRIGTAVSLRLSASGGTAPYTWSASGLPTGLSIGTTNGLVSGTPTTNGTFTPSVTAKDASGATASTSFTWTVSSTGGGSAVFSDDFESDKGWTVNASGTDTATAGVWDRGNPDRTTSASSGQIKQLGTTVSGVGALSTGSAAGASDGANDLDGGVTTVFSAPIALPSAGSLTLHFSYNVAHGNNSGSDDHLKVRVLDGTQATTVFTKTGAASEVAGKWQTGSADLSAFAGKSVRVFLEAADAGTPSLFEAQVDDVSITNG